MITLFVRLIKNTVFLRYMQEVNTATLKIEEIDIEISIVYENQLQVIFILCEEKLQCRV